MKMVIQTKEMDSNQTCVAIAHKRHLLHILS